MVLSGKSLETLYQRGIEIERDSHGPIIKLTPKGVAWLLNYKMVKGIQRPLKLSQAVLRAIAQEAPDPKKFRPLAVKLIPLPAGMGDRSYLSFAFYLEGTPLSKVNLLATDTFGEFTGRIEVTKGLFKSFDLMGDQGITIEFSEKERAALTEGNVLRITADELS